MSQTIRSRSMTEGVIWKQLVAFAIPLLIGNLFQQLYNTVDSIVVGNFVGKEALAAVGATANMVNVLVGIFTGLSTGATVVISQYFGAKDKENLHEAVHTTVFMTLICGILFAILGVAITPMMLGIMKVPADVLPQATLYLRIYFAGIMGLMLYNMGAGILRAVGDSKRPLYFLCLSSVINIVLDLAFVIFFHMGVAGVAIATIIAQFISAFFIFYTLARTTEDYRFVPRDIRMNRAIFTRILVIGLPAALQMSITSISNVFVQSYVNYFGSSAMAGWSAYNRIDHFIVLPMQSLGVAATTFVGQNVGAGKMERTVRGTRQAVLLSIGVTLVLTALLYLMCMPLLKVFNQDPEVLEYGMICMHAFSPFYSFFAIYSVYSGALRGAGDSKASMYGMLACNVVLRQIFLIFAKKYFYSFWIVAFSYPMAWIPCAAYMYLYFRIGRWKKRAIVAQKEAET